MKKLILFLLSAFAFTSVYAQDLVTTKDGEDIEVIVQEVGPRYVKYKLFSEPEGVTYSVKKSDLLMIRYASGRKEIFGKSRNDLFDDGREPVEGISPNMKYGQLKKLYNFRDYVPTYGDRYSPAWTGVASFFIPGLGQCINNEWGRGLGEFFGSAALMTVGSVCSQLSYYEDASPYYQMEIAAAVVCYAAALSLDIWSIIETIRIAKVKNMYERDLKKLYAVDVKLYPSVNCAVSAKGVKPTVGLTLAMKF